MTESRERRKQNLRHLREGRTRGAHLDGAEGDLELLETKEDDGNVVEEEGVPAAELDGAGPIRVS